MNTPRAPWPYPRWIAHRGAGKLAPENTLAAFRLGAQYGYRMFECDVKLSADGEPFLLHDATLERTTAGHGIAGKLSWHDISQLDAGSWHSRGYTSEPPPHFDGIARYCLTNGFDLDIEIKPTPGQESETGRVVAKRAAELWAAHAQRAGRAITPPFLTSFQPAALAAARDAAPHLPRGLLLDTLPADWIAQALQLDCVAIVCNFALWTADTVAQAKAAGFRCLSYTVNDEWATEHLWALGTDGIVTDRVDKFSPNT